jgi:replicative DNA helicase
MPAYNLPADAPSPRLNNPDVEMSVVGAMILDCECAAEGIARLTPDMFVYPANREVFNTIADLSAKNTPVDLVTIDAELTRRGTLEKIGGLPYLVSLSQHVPTTANAPAHIKILRDLYQMRRLQAAAGVINGLVRSYDGDAEGTLAKAQKALFDVSLTGLASGRIQHISKPIAKVYEQASERAVSGETTSGVPTGIVSLDDVTDGLRGGQLVIIGARPSMGKTALALNMLANAAQSGKSCILFSLEMPAEQIAARMLCGKASVEMRRFTGGKLNDSDWDCLSLSLGIMSGLPIWVSDSSALTPSQLTSLLRLAVMRHGVQMAMIDYLQLMRADDKPRTRVEEVTEITRALKSTANELNIPLVVCAQLSRANTMRQNKQPVLSDLRDSGSIEQDADVVMFLHREAYYDHDANPAAAELIVAKNRNGETGRIDMVWEAETMTFLDVGKGIG